jgi:carbon-monoxide dehydrogenase large subunit
MGEVIGQAQSRVDGLEKVTGQAKFLADLSLGRVVHARVLRSTQAHAHIRRLDANRARSAPGVKAVVTGQDCPDRIGHAIRDQYPIARDKVRYWGEPVAVVVAATPEAAEAAVALIDVGYAALPAILHPRRAVAEGAPLIHAALADCLRDPRIHAVSGSNICHHYQLRRCDYEILITPPMLMEALEIRKEGRCMRDRLSLDIPRSE